MPQQTDYGAIARQFGGQQAPSAPPPVDYSTMAREFGGAPDVRSPDFSTSNERDASGAPVVAPRRHPHAQVAETAGKFLSELKSLNPMEINRAVQQAFWHPIETVKGALSAQEGVRAEAQKAFEAGDYTRGVGKMLDWLVPILGPRMSEAGDLLESGETARGMGALTDVGVQVGGPKALSTVTGKASVGLRPKAPVNPAEARAVQFGLQEGIPVDAATATGNRFVRGVQRLADESALGSVTAERAKAAEATALKRVGNKLATEANPGGVAVDAIGAGEGVQGARTGQIQAEAVKANTAYDALRKFEAAAPMESVPARPPAAPTAPGIPPQQVFMLRWLAEDLREMPYQAGGSTKLQRAEAIENWRPGDPEHLRVGYVPSGRVAGTPTLDTLQAMGVSGSRAEIAAKLEAYLQGRTKDPRFGAYADAMAEAWDGASFDWDLVSDATLTRTGLRRRQLRGPMTGPDMSSPGTDLFFPNEAANRPTAQRDFGASGMESQRFAVDLRASKAGLKPLFDDLMAERDVAGVLMGGKATAAKALKGLLEGPDFAPLSVVDAALGDIKALSRGAEMPALRTQGQGIAAESVKQLEAAVRARAAQAGPQVLKALEDGRAATKAKYDVAEALDFADTTKEPRAVFNRLTAAKDAGVKKLREVKRLTPDQLPSVARALLEDILQHPTSKGGFDFADKAWADWQRVGSETRRLLFPKPGHAAALDDFFLLAKKLAENPNPSGTALTAWKGGELAAWFGAPQVGIPYSIGAGVASKVLHSPKAVNLLTRGLRLSVSAAPAARTLAAAQIAQALKEAGVAIPATVDEPPVDARPGAISPGPAGRTTSGAPRP